MAVFVVAKPKPGPQGNTYDISPAQEYGSVSFIFDAYENPSANPRKAIEQVRNALLDFNPSTDYIVTAGGDPYGALLVGFVLCEMNLPLRYLRFERLRSRIASSDNENASHEIVKSGYYVPVVMPQEAY